MPEIKTRDAVKGTIKTLDRAAVAGERMKDAYVRTKDKAKQGAYSADGSPEEYAADRFSGSTEAVTYEAAHKFDKHGRRLFIRPKTIFQPPKIGWNNIKLTSRKEQRRSRQKRRLLLLLGKLAVHKVLQGMSMVAVRRVVLSIFPSRSLRRRAGNLRESKPLREADGQSKRRVPAELLRKDLSKEQLRRRSELLRLLSERQGLRSRRPMPLHRPPKNLQWQQFLYSGQCRGGSL